jgi:hypothetical protein
MSLQPRRLSPLECSLIIDPCEIGTCWISISSAPRPHGSAVEQPQFPSIIVKSGAIICGATCYEPIPLDTTLPLRLSVGICPVALYVQLLPLSNLDTSHDFIAIYPIRPKVLSVNNDHGLLSKWPEWQLACVLHYAG